MPGWWPCPECCHPGCVIAEDDFDRGDTTLLGGLWEELEGDTEIDEQTLVMPDGDERVLCTEPHPVIKTPTCQGNVVFVNLEDGAHYRITVNADKNGEGGEPIEFWVDGSTSWLQVGEEDPEETGQVPEDDTVTLSYCRNLTGLFADVDFAMPPVYTVLGPEPGGRYVTLENEGSVEVAWDDFVYREHVLTDPDCYRCYCDCDHYAIPKFLLATIISASGCCSCWEGMETVLAYRFGDAGVFEWFGGFGPIMSCGLPASGPEVLTLKCLAGTNFELCSGNPGSSTACGFGDPAGSTCDALGGLAIPTSITCNPFSLTFAVLNCACGAEEPNCIYTLLITEDPNGGASSSSSSSGP